MIAAVASLSFILFTIIDMPGNLPLLISMKKEGIEVNPILSTIVAGIIMYVFLFTGTNLLALMGIDVSSFAIAGSLIIFFIGLEMVLGIRFFRDTHSEGANGTIVPVAFPLIAGAGTLTTLISFKTNYEMSEIMIAIAINLIFVFAFIKSSAWLSNKLSDQAISTLRKIFGIILLSIAVQMFKNNIV